MSDNANTAPTPEDPDVGGGEGPEEGMPGPEGAADVDLEALSSEEQQSAFAEAGVSDDLVALRDAVEATLLAASGEMESLAEESPSQGILGVGIGLPDPTSLSIGGVPGEPSLTLFTESPLPQEQLLSQVAESAGTRALSTVPVEQVPVGSVDAYSFRGRRESSSSSRG